MQIVNGVVFDSRPAEVTIYPSSVYVARNIKEIQVTDETGEGEHITQTKYQADCDIYEHYEYIELQDSQYTALKSETDELRLAMNELIGGGEA